MLVRTKAEGDTVKVGAAFVSGNPYSILRVNQSARTIHDIFGASVGIMTAILSWPHIRRTGWILAQIDCAKR